MTGAPDWALALALASLAALALVAWGYAGYPLAIRLLVPPRRRAPDAAADRHDWPTVSVLVAAHDEAAVIGERIANLLEQDYPRDLLEILVVSDASTDGTDAVVAAIGDPRVRLVRQEPRAGKTAGINRLVPHSRGEILVQTDANVRFARDAVRKLVQPFADPSVGVTIGEVTFTNEDEPEVAHGEGLYWRYESWTKRVEAERGLLCVANGGIYALRRELWRPLPPAISGDAAEPLLAARAGRVTAIAHGARAYERAAATLGEEFARKARIVAQQVACARWIGLASLPGPIRFAYVSHKLTRYAAPFLTGAGVAAGIASGWGGVWLGWIAAGAGLAPLALAPLAALRLPGPLGAVARIALYWCAVNAAAVVGVVRGLGGRAQATWTSPASSRAGADALAAGGETRSQPR